MPQADLTAIQADVVYPLSDFERRSGLGRHAMRQARRRGLKVIRFGGRAFVRGNDFQAFLASIAEQADSAND